ncbi:hypothetical protein GCM10020000_11480 [Streptomyces olivoverticillatus]
MPVAGQQPRLAQACSQRGAAAVGEAAQLHVAARGDVEVPVAELVGGVRERDGLASRQQPAGQADTREGPVVRGMQAQGAGAGVGAVAGGEGGHAASIPTGALHG